MGTEERIRALLEEWNVKKEEYREKWVNMKHHWPAKYVSTEFVLMVKGIRSHRICTRKRSQNDNIQDLRADTGTGNERLRAEK